MKVPRTLSISSGTTSDSARMQSAGRGGRGNISTHTQPSLMSTSNGPITPDGRELQVKPHGENLIGRTGKGNHRGLIIRCSLELEPLPTTLEIMERHKADLAMYESSVVARAVEDAKAAPQRRGRGLAPAPKKLKPPKKPKVKKTKPIVISQPLDRDDTATRLQISDSENVSLSRTAPLNDLESEEPISKRRLGSASKARRESAETVVGQSTGARTHRSSKRLTWFRKRSSGRSSFSYTTPSFSHTSVHDTSSSIETFSSSITGQASSGFGSPLMTPVYAPSDIASIASNSSQFSLHNPPSEIGSQKQLDPVSELAEYTSFFAI